MENKVSKKELMGLRQAAIIESERMKCFQILLDGNRKHEEQLRTSLTFYICSMLRTFSDGVDDGSVWNELLRQSYEDMMDTAERRFSGIREDIDYLCRELDKERKKREEAEEHARAERARKKAENQGDRQIQDRIFQTTTSRSIQAETTTDRTHNIRK